MWLRDREESVLAWKEAALAVSETGKGVKGVG